MKKIKTIKQANAYLKDKNKDIINHMWDQSFDSIVEIANVYYEMEQQKCFICKKDIKNLHIWNNKPLCSQECKNICSEQCQEYDLKNLWK